MARSGRSPAPLPPLPARGVAPHRRLWQLRMERQISLAELGALAGLRPATICEIERGRTEIPERRTLEKLAVAFGMTLEELRQQIGMHGPMYGSPAPAPDREEEHHWSPRAEQIAGLVETLPIPEQEFVYRLCSYLQARRTIDVNRIRVENDV